LFCLEAEADEEDVEDDDGVGAGGQDWYPADEDAKP
jgi:hypothetical protein